MENKDILRTFWGWKPWKKNIEPHENVTGPYKKITVEIMDEFQDPQIIKW